MEIYPTNFGSSSHLVSEVQHRGIRKNNGSTPTTTVLEQKAKEKKRQYQKRKLSTKKSALTRKYASKKALVTKAPRVNDDALQPGGALDRRLNYDNPHWPKPVTGSGLAYQLF